MWWLIRAISQTQIRELRRLSACTQCSNRRLSGLPFSPIFSNFPLLHTQRVFGVKLHLNQIQASWSKLWIFAKRLSVISLGPCTTAGFWRSSRLLSERKIRLRLVLLNIRVDQRGERQKRPRESRVVSRWNRRNQCKWSERQKSNHLTFLVHLEVVQ